MSRPDFTELAVERSGGAKMTLASWQHVATFLAEVPPANVRPALDAGFKSVWKAIVDLPKEIAKLTRTRDDLLQLLISDLVLLRETVEAMA